MRTSSKIIGALAAAGLVAAGGAAFTDSNSVATSIAGYGTATVSGATASAVTHTLSTDGTEILTSVITFSETQAGNTVKAAFGTADLQNCVVTTTTATCTYSPTFVTADAQAFNVSVIKTVS